MKPQKTNWKDPPCLMGNLTISTGPCSMEETVSHYQRVSPFWGCLVLGGPGVENLEGWVQGGAPFDRSVGANNSNNHMAYWEI